jgi:hypothetical protein
MITAGLGVGLLPLGQPVQPGVRLLPLTGPRIELRAYAAARRGRLSWPPLALMISLLRQASRLSPPRAAWAARVAVAAAGAARFALTARIQEPAPASPAAVSADRRHA